MHDNDNSQDCVRERESGRTEKWLVCVCVWGGGGQHTRERMMCGTTLANGAGTTHSVTDGRKCVNTNGN